MRILHECVVCVKNAIDKVNLITAHNYGRPKWHSLTPKIFGVDIVSQNVRYNRKQTTEPHLLIFVLFFSGKDTPSADISYCIHIL